MPTVFDKVTRSYLLRSPHKQAHGLSKEVGEYIVKSSIDLSDAATYTINRDTKAAQKIFANVPQEQLRRELKQTYSGTGRRRPRRKASIIQAAVDDHTYASLPSTETRLHNNDTQEKRLNLESESKNRNNANNTNWRTTNPNPGMGEFRMMAKSSQQTLFAAAEQLSDIEQSMRNVGRINYMQFAPDLMPSPPQKKKSKTSFSMSRGKKTEMNAKKRDRKLNKQARKEKEAWNELEQKRHAKEHKRTHHTNTKKTFEKQRLKAIQKRNNRRADQRRAQENRIERKAMQIRADTVHARVDKLHEKKLALKQKKQDKIDRQKATLRLQALARGRRDRKHTTQKKDELHATKKIQAMHRGRRDRTKVHKIKKIKNEQDTAIKKIQAVRRGKQDRKKVHALKIQRKKEIEASRKIQAIRRGKNDRQKVKEIKASRKIQAIHRGKRGRRKVHKKKELIEQEAATLKIQAALRGKKGRKAAKTKSKRKKVLKEQEAATLKIQAVLRGKKGRKAAQLKKHRTTPKGRNEAATKIQAMYRMFGAKEQYHDEIDGVLLMQSLMRGAIHRRQMKKTKEQEQARLETKNDEPDGGATETLQELDLAIENARSQAHKAEVAEDDDAENEARTLMKQLKVKRKTLINEELTRIDEESDEESEEESDYDDDMYLDATNATLLVAIEDFEAEEDGDIGFREGDELWGLKKHDGWWTGRHTDATEGIGHFPADEVVESHINQWRFLS